MSKTFTAIDFETANHSGNSICQVGLVRVERGKIIEQLDLLVKPPDNYYHRIHMGIHGITPAHTAKAPTFNKVWPEIKDFIANQNVVAHNISFDARVLVNTLSHYKIKTPEFNRYCTLKIYGAGLSELSRKYKIELDHHKALSDALACAKLYLIHLK